MERPLNIYFFGSIFGAPSDPKFNQKLISYLKTKGNVLSEHLFDDDYRQKEKLSPRGIHDRDLNWIRQSRVMVGDVTSPSLGVGYELRDGVLLGKHILCLYRPQEGKNLSAMIEGSPEIRVGKYQSLDDAILLIDDFFGSLKL